jgi:hypothetical protein
MSDATTTHGGAAAPAIPDVSTIADPNTRRAMRAVVQQNVHLTAQLQQHQMEIEALLHMLVEKHVGSVGEFKRHMLRLQANDARSGRLHEQIAGMGTVSHAAAPSAVAPRHAEPPPPSRLAEPEIDRPRRYTL